MGKKNHISIKAVFCPSSYHTTEFSSAACFFKRLFKDSFSLVCAFKLPETFKPVLWFVLDEGSGKVSNALKSISLKHIASPMWFWFTPKKACSSKKHTFEDAVQRQQLPLHDVAKLFCFTFQPNKHLEDADVQRVAGSWLTDTSTKNKKKLWHNKNSFNRYLDSRFVEASLDDFPKKWHLNFNFALPRFRADGRLLCQHLHLFHSVKTDHFYMRISVASKEISWTCLNLFTVSSLTADWSAVLFRVKSEIQRDPHTSDVWVSRVVLMINFMLMMHVYILRCSWRSISNLLYF